MSETLHAELPAQLQAAALTGACQILVSRAGAEKKSPEDLAKEAAHLAWYLLQQFELARP